MLSATRAFHAGNSSLTQAGTYHPLSHNKLFTARPSRPTFSRKAARCARSRAAVILASSKPPPPPPERNTNEAWTPHSSFHYSGDTTRRAFEGWYVRLTLPEEKASFAFIHAIEDPAGTSPLSKVTSQVMGPNGEYLLQHSRDVGCFWADKEHMAFGACFKSTSSNTTAPRSIVSEEEFAARVEQGFQATDTWQQGALCPTPLDGDMAAPAEGAATSNLGSARWAFELQPVYGWGDSVVQHPGLACNAMCAGSAAAAGNGAARSAAGRVEGSSGSRTGSSSTGQAGNGSSPGQTGNHLHGSSTGRAQAQASSKSSNGGGAVKEKQQQKATTGWLALSPLFDPQWQVCVALALATGWVELDGRRYCFANAPVHIEKNWGAGFPKKWFWLQANAFPSHPGLKLAAVGAQRRMVQPYGGYAEVGIVGIHWKGEFIELVPWNAGMEWEVEPWGSWKVRGSNGEYRVEIEATSEDSGLLLRGPHEERGFIPNCRDSFQGSLRLRLWRTPPHAPLLPPPLRPEPELVLDASTELGAVEVGGGPWEGPWHSKCTVPQLVRSALARPLDLGKTVGDVLG